MIYHDKSLENVTTKGIDLCQVSKNIQLKVFVWVYLSIIIVLQIEIRSLITCYYKIWNFLQKLQ